MPDPGSRSLTLTGRQPYAYGGPGLRLVSYEPEVLLTGNHTISVPEGSLSLTAQTPSVSITINIAPGDGSVSITGHVPTLSQSDNQIRAPPAGSLNLTGLLSYNYGGPGLRIIGYEPSILIEETVTAVTPSVGNLSLTGYSPTPELSENVIELPGPGSLELTGLQPTVEVGSSVIAEPAAGALALTEHAPALEIIITNADSSLFLTGYAPVLDFTWTTLPDAGSLALTGHQPAAQLGDSIIEQPDAGSLSLTGYAPAIAFDWLVSPDAGSLGLIGYTPTLGFDWVTQPNTDSLTINGLAPVIAITGPGEINVPEGGLTLTGYQPSIDVTDEVSAPVPIITEDGGGALGRSGQHKRQKKKDDEDFMRIVELAMPEIVKYLDKS